MHNAVLEIMFSDSQSSNGTPGGLQNFVYTATGGEHSFQDDSLIDAEVLSVSIDGIAYTIVDAFSGNPKKEVKFTANGIDEGTITLHPGLPNLEPDTDIIVQFMPAGQNPINVSEPVTLQQAKDWLKVEVDDDDTIIGMCITAARQACEGFTALSFVNRTVTAVLKNELGGIRLPYGPVISINEAKDSDGNDVEYTLTGEQAKRLQSPCSCYVKIEYHAGYSALPQKFKTAVLEQMAWIYQHRGDETAAELSPMAMIMLKPYRLVV